jgi:hypothetical protein
VEVHDTPQPRDDPGILEGRPHQPCAACGSDDTECIWFDGGGSIIGSWKESEHRCRVCGKYSVYEEDYES